eukprot:7420618-Ditylum_brightwellii.AAC.1
MVELSVVVGVGGSRYPISFNAILSSSPFYAFAYKAVTSASELDAMTFLITSHTECTGPFSGICPVGFLPRSCGLEERKKWH